MTNDDNTKTPLPTSAAAKCSKPHAGPEMPVNPYGGGPSTGFQFPPYYKPTPSVRSRNNYFPGSETLGPDEMRISFVGSCPFPPRRDQAGTCIMVELGNGDRFFFDFGPGCVKNILAMGVSVPEINDIFITHLHVDHYHDLSYLLPFSAWAGDGNSRCASPARPAALPIWAPKAWSPE